MAASPMRPRVLVVEDEAALVTLLRYNLEKAGFEVAVATAGEEALLLIAEAPPDLVLLDWMLPEVSGLEICRRLRRNKETRSLPVIMLTARGEEADRVRGLNWGADDYITKPFSPTELVARVQAVLRRARPALDAESLQYADIVMDTASHRVTRDGKTIELRPAEYRLLQFLLEHPGRVFSRDQLLDLVWRDDATIDPRTVDVHVRRLRKALNADGGTDIIRTVRSAGYALDQEQL
jgi:two-component system phosphate regulon response regulator PhoB